MRAFLLLLKPRFGSQVFAAAMLVYLLLSLALAFTYQNVREEGHPLQSTQGLNITGLPEESTKEQALAQISRAAVDNKVNLFLASYAAGSLADNHADNHSGVPRQTLFAFIGNREILPAQLSALPGSDASYRGFNPGLNLKVESYQKIVAEDLRNTAYIQGSSAQGEAAVKQLEGEGFKTAYFETFPSYPSLAALFTDLSGKLSTPIVLIAGLGLLVASVYYPSRRFRVAATRESWGWHRSYALAREYGNIVSAYALLSALIGLLGCGLLLAYNGGFGMGELLGGFALLSLVGLALVLLGQTLVTLRLMRYRLGEVLKGRRPLAIITSVAITAQLIGLAGGFFAVGVVVNAGIQAESRTQDSKDWEQAGSLATLTFGALAFVNDSQNFDPKFSQLIEEQNQRGQIILAIPPDTNERVYTTRTRPEDPPPIPQLKYVLTVNNAYLQRQPLYDSEDRRIENLPEGEYLAVPPSLKSEGDILWQRLEDIRQEQALGESSPPPQIQKISLRAGQTLFNYSTNSSEKGPRQYEPIVRIVVGEAAAGPVNISAGNGQAMFTDAASLQEALDRYGLREYVSSIDTVAGRALAEIAYQLNLLRIMALGAVLTFITVLASTLVLTSVYVDRNRRRIFVQAIHGEGPWGLHRKYFRLLILLTAAPLALVLLLMLVSVAASWAYPPVLVAAVAVILLGAVAAIWQTRKTVTASLREA